MGTRKGLGGTIDPAEAPTAKPFCACGRREPECDGSRAGCHTTRNCRRLTRQVNHGLCWLCRRRDDERLGFGQR